MTLLEGKTAKSEKELKCYVFIKELYILYRVVVVSVFGSVLGGQNGKVGPLYAAIEYCFSMSSTCVKNGFRLRRGSASVASWMICYLCEDATTSRKSAGGFLFLSCNYSVGQTHKSVACFSLR